MLNSMSLPVFVVSLARATARRADMKKRLAAAGVKFEFVDAVDGAELDLAKYQHRIKDKKMSPKTIGCFLSHYNLWQRIADEKISFAIILEDDALLNNDFMKTAAQLPNINWYWEVINLCYSHRIRVETSVCEVGAYKIVRNARPTNTAAGYAISLRGAQKCLAYCYEIKQGVDLQRRQYYAYGLHFYSIDPPLGSQSGAPSTINDRVKFSKINHIARLYRKVRYAVYNFSHRPKPHKILVKSNSFSQTHEAMTMNKAKLHMIWEILTDIATCDCGSIRKITYNDLAKQVGYEEQNMTPLFGNLQKIESKCNELNLPSLPALVVNKDTSFPGGSFGSHIHGCNWEIKNKFPTKKFMKWHCKYLQEVLAERWKDVANPFDAESGE